MKKVILLYIIILLSVAKISSQNEYYVKANTKFKNERNYSVEEKFIMTHFPDSILYNLKNSSRKMRIGDRGDYISLDYIDSIRSLLINKKLYLNVRRWVKETGHKPESADDYVMKKRYIPVVITGIGIGYDNYEPIKIVFKTKDNEEYYLLVNFSIEDNYIIEETHFVTAFLLNNPRDKFKQIPDNIWNLICLEKVKIGMTKQQCKLSWGEPESINKTSGSWGVHEQWVYGTTSYLYFENGKLTSIQN